MYNAQFGEDAILAQIFADTPSGTCIEVGANDGITGSATLFFEGLGWDCILVEPVPELARRLRQGRRAKVFECAASSADGEATLHVATGAPLAHAVSTIGGAASADAIRKNHGHATTPVQVRTRSLDDILSEARVSTVDFITLDVEGHELEALRGLSLERWRPRIVIIEDNTLLGDRAVCGLLHGAGYVRINRTGVNDWWAAKSDPLASPRARLGYYPALLKGHLVTFAMTRLGPALPWLSKLPGVARLRDAMLG
jgi:FkbM family methyltransferase